MFLHDILYILAAEGDTAEIIAEVSEIIKIL